MADDVNPWLLGYDDPTTPSVTYDKIIAAMRRIEDATPVVVVHGPESKSVIEQMMGDRVRVVQSEHVERGEVFMFYPSALDHLGEDGWRDSFVKITNVGEV